MVHLALMLHRQSHIYLSAPHVGDIEVEICTNPPVKLATGFAWKGIEDYWSDLVNELPEIPIGGNNYFFNKIQPKLSEGTICYLRPVPCPSRLIVLLMPTCLLSVTLCILARCTQVCACALHQYLDVLWFQA